MKGHAKRKIVDFSVLALFALCCLLPKLSFSQEKNLPQVDVFFQDYDFNDTSLMHAEAFTRKLAEYVYQFYENEDFVTAFAAVNYAYGWIDCGARIGLWDVGQDDQLFTLYE